MRMLCVAVLVAATGAWAQCSSDAECPAGGACTNGVCATPTTQPAPASDGRGVSVGNQTEKQRRHWAGGAAAIGFAGTGPVVASGVMAMFFLILGSSNLNAGIAFTLITMALVGALGPVVELGAASARFEPTNEGSPGGRVMGWVFYGLSLAGGVASLGILAGTGGSSGITFFTAFGMMISGGLALICFSVDAVVSGAHANAVNRTRAESAPVRLMPGFALAPSPRGDLSPVVGLTGVF